MKKTIVEIDKFPIRLGQFLKCANLVQDGLEAKMMIQDGMVHVNGVIETRRGRKLNNNDEILVTGFSILVARQAG